METLAETVQHKGYTVAIHYDHEYGSGNPRDADNLGIMLALGHRNYTLGDASVNGGYSNREEYQQLEAAHNALMERLPTRLALRAFCLYLKVYHGASVILPLGLIDHSGISMYVGGGAHPMDPGGWDSGMVGFIFDTEQTRETTGCTPENGFDAEKIEQGLRDEVQNYDMYLTGQVYGYVITDPDGDPIDDDSCWGFLGIRSVKEEAIGAVDTEVERREANPKKALPTVTVAKFTVEDANEILGRPLLQSEVDTLRKHLEHALADPFADAVHSMP